MRPLCVWFCSMLWLGLSASLGFAGMPAVPRPTERPCVPVLSSLAPSTAAVGAAQVDLTLTGSGFTVTAQVDFAGMLLQPTSIAATTMSVVVPGSLLRRAGIERVRVVDGGSSSGFLDFRILSPSIVALVPSEAPVGTASVALEVSGANFVPGSIVFVDNQSMSTQFVGEDRIQCTLTTAQLATPALLPVRVENATGLSGNNSNQLDFAVRQIPTIQSLTPSSRLVGSGSFTLSVLGAGFAMGHRIVWNGARLSTQFRSATLLEASISSSRLTTAGIALVQVENSAPWGGLSASLSFSIENPVPALSSVSPSAVLVGDPTLSVTFTGSGFNAQSVPSLRGTPLLVQSFQPSTLRAEIPAALLDPPAQTVLRVENPAPGGGFAEIAFLIQHGVPIASSLAPTTVLVGSSAFTLDVFGPASGSRFHAQSEVRWDNAPLVTTLVAANQLRVTVEASRLLQPALHAITVWNPAPGGGTSNALSFTVANPVPQVLFVAPSFATAGSSGLTVTVTGSSFAAGCRVTWDGLALATTQLDANRATAVLSATRLELGGVRAVGISNLGPGGGLSNTVPFTVFNPAPVLLSVSPTRIDAGSGLTSIFLTGSSFVRQCVARWNGAALPTTYLSPTSLRADVPSASLVNAGVASITVFAPAPGGGTSAGRTIDVVNPVPSLYWASRLLTGAGTPATPITLIGGGLNTQSRVRVTSPLFPGGVLLTPTATSASTLYISMPGGVFALPQEARITVENPAPGGGTSNALPFAFADAPTPIVDANPVTFSVNGPVDAQTEGLRWPRGGGPSVPYVSRVLPVFPAFGLPTLRPGDVNDYLFAFPASIPSEAELFQSEPDLGGLWPTGTNNQILVADVLGLVAGRPFMPYHDNIDGVSFGEDHFGVTSVLAPSGIASGANTAWSLRFGAFLPNVVTGDSGTSFRLSVNPWARGLERTGIAIESLGRDNAPGGLWSSDGNAASDVFGTPVLTLPGAAPLGTHTLVHARLPLALADRTSGAPQAEDDLDALECAGANDPLSWFIALPGGLLPGDLHARTLPVFHPLGPLAPPGEVAHRIALDSGFFPMSAPLFFTVDRRSTGKALSAVRTQWRLGEAAADVFMTVDDSNLLLIDEQEAGLYAGVLGSVPSDDMDGLILHVHPEDRYHLIELATRYLPYSGMVVENDPDGVPMSGDEYRTGPGYSYSLMRYNAQLPMPLTLRIRLGFSVSTDSIGLAGTPVDYEAGLDPSGTMQQSGDIYFTQFGDYGDGMGVINPAPPAVRGTHYRWYEETELGLSAGAWSLGVSTDLAVLPDELNALDSHMLAPGCPGLAARYGSGCPGIGGRVPDLSLTGCPATGWTFSLGVSNAVAGGAALLLPSTGATELPFLTGLDLLVGFDAFSNYFAQGLTSYAGATGASRIAFTVPPGLTGAELAWQALILDPSSPNGLLSSTNGVMIRLE